MSFLEPKNPQPFRVPIIGDIHFGARGDSQIVYSIQERFYRDVFWPAIDAEGEVHTLVISGDVMDRRKFVNYQTLAFAKHMLFEPALQRQINIWWVLGNHDMPYKHSLQLSCHEAFKEYENVNLITTATEVLIDENTSVLMMPWLCDENEAASMAALKAYDGSVVIGHFEFGGFEMYRGMPNTHGVLDPSLFAHFKLVMSGHYHHKSSRGNIHYLGAPYEMVWSDWNDPRGFHWWTPETHGLEFVPNPHHLFYRFVYDDTEKTGNYVKTLLDEMKAADIEQKMVKVTVKHKTQPMMFETFVDAALKLGAFDLQFVDDTAWSTEDTHADEHEPTMDTLTMIHQYVSGLPWANSEIQNDVTDLMTELYHEASDMSKTLART